MPDKCVYCDINDVGFSEHVFPKSLGGEDIYMDCVCNSCNNKFSKIERELFQKSIIALMRSAEGVEGYKRNKLRPAPLKYPEIFHFDKEYKVVYEIGLFSGFKPFMRPQIIRIAGNFYIEGATNEELNLFVAVFNKWRSESLKIVTKFPIKPSKKSEGVIYNPNLYKYPYEKIELDRIKNEIVHYDLSPSVNFKDYFEPRLFLDDNSKLIVRSRTVLESIEFIKDFLEYWNNPTIKFSSFPTKNLSEPIYVSFKFNMEMMQQALVKIGLNCLMNYFPDTKYDSLLAPAKNFVMYAKSISAGISDRMQYMDLDNEIHYVIFLQREDGLLVRTSLFGSHFIYSFLIHDLKLLNRNGQFRAVEVNYRTKIQKFLSSDAFVLNRIQNLGWLDNKNDL
jgi:hypothetical protein